MQSWQMLINVSVISSAIPKMMIKGEDDRKLIDQKVRSALHDSKTIKVSGIHQICRPYRRQCLCKWLELQQQFRPSGLCGLIPDLSSCLERKGHHRHSVCVFRKQTVSGNHAKWSFNSLVIWAKNPRIIFFLHVLLLGSGSQEPSLTNASNSAACPFKTSKTLRWPSILSFPIE